MRYPNMEPKVNGQLETVAIDDSIYNGVILVHGSRPKDGHAGIARFAQEPLEVALA